MNLYELTESMLAVQELLELISLRALTQTQSMVVIV